MAKETSRQVDWSKGPPGADDEGGVVDGDELPAATELDGVVELDDEADDDEPFEHPAVTIATASTPAKVRSRRIGGSLILRMCLL
ncbi:hypothetical protein [Mycobacterium seoulense]|uniref:hypothetical protein n=1 Tax=Mycobacterium seoulense TaxID=386911 RepID=UPI003CE7F882